MASPLQEHERKVRLLVIGVMLGLLLAAASLTVARWWQRRLRPPESDEECGMCGKQMNQRQAHLFVSRPDDDVEAELGGIGGTFVSVAFCGTHCPGRCRNPRCRAKLVV